MVAAPAFADTVAAHFSSASDVPISSASYTAAGNEVNLSIGFDPATGTRLVVVNNTGIGFIEGQFINLAHGDLVVLEFGGLLYRFVANYYGGTGNDLVLEWYRREVDAWGENSGRLGNGETATSGVPVAVVSSGVLSGKTVVALAAGGSHSLALCSDGTVACWGVNTYGELGIGSSKKATVPVAVNLGGVLAGKTVVAVAAGSSHSLALCSDGTVAAWGRNLEGQLGDGSMTNQSSPVAVDETGVLSGKTVVAVAAGGSHSLVLCSDGTVVAWGANTYGQLGDGGVDPYRATPTAVSVSGVLSGKVVAAIASGREFSLARCSDGTLVSWGSGDSGQLGNGSTSNSNSPVAVTVSGVLASKTVVAIAAGGAHALALCADGMLASWGANGSGRLGDGANTNRLTPVAVNQTGVLLGKTLVSIAAGGSHSHGLCSDGTVSSWGSGSSGQMGNGSTTVGNYVPGRVVQSGVLADKPVVLIAAGGSHSLVLSAHPMSSKLSGLDLSEGTVSLPLSSRTYLYANLLESTASIAVTPTTKSNYATVQVNGENVASGTPSSEIPLPLENDMFQVKVTSEDGSFTDYIVSTVKTVDFVYASASDVPAAFAGFDANGWSANLALGFSPPVGTNLMVVDNKGVGFITGEFTDLAHGQMVELAYGGVTYQFVANYFGGNGNDLVLEWAHRSILSWGNNQYGQLGVGSDSTESRVPMMVPKTDVIAGKCMLAVGGGHGRGLALCSDGTIVAWGNDGYSNAISDSNVPVATNLGSLTGKRVVAISAANVNNLALCSDGTVSAWGYGGFGQLGNGSTSYQKTPSAVDTTGVLNGYSVVAISSGGTHCLALRSDGKVVAWGRNDNGQLGDRTRTDQTVPVLVRTTSGALKDKTVVAIATGFDHSLALCSDGTLAVWGNNSNGQLGNGGGGYESTPVSVNQTGVLAGKTVTALSHGARYNSLVLCSDGTMATWGENGSGQLGNGSSSSKSTVPVAVNHTGPLLGKTVVSVSSGYQTNVAVCSDGSVVTWGLNFYGSLGDGSTVSMSRVPVAVTSTGELHGRKALSAGVGFQCHLIAAEPANGYIAWMSGQSGVPDKTESADPDADGIPNLIEYALHGDPATSSTAILPTVSADGDDFVFSFNRLASAAEDTSQTFEWSPDLVTWMPVNVGSNPDSGVLLGSVDGNGQQAVTVTVPKNTNSSMFGRLTVSRP